MKPTFWMTAEETERELKRRENLLAKYGEQGLANLERARKDRKNAARRAKHQAYLDCGLKRVRGALGGIYYE